MIPDGLTERVAQQLWQCYAVETGRSLPEGLADKLAETAVNAVLDEPQNEAELF